MFTSAFGRRNWLFWLSGFVVSSRAIEWAGQERTQLPSIILPSFSGERKTARGGGNVCPQKHGLLDGVLLGGKRHLYRASRRHIAVSRRPAVGRTCNDPPSVVALV